MKVLVTGGTGALGRRLLPLLIHNRLIERIRVLSRDEHEQQRLAEKLNGKVDWFIGDICNRDRVDAAMRGVDLVYHLAAMKTVDGCEYQPVTAVEVNILGTANVVHCALKNRVQRAIFISSDKAVAPLNLYGVTKATAEKLFIQGNVGSLTKFAACRYGNVLASTGSVLEKWIERASTRGFITLTNPEMSRFWWTPEAAAEFVDNAMETMRGAEIFIPKMKAATMGRLAWAFQEVASERLGCVPEIKEIPRRPGEKLHELLYSDDESHLVYEQNEHYVRYPSSEFYPVVVRGKRVHHYGYSSASAPQFTDEELCELVASQWPKDELLESALEQVRRMWG